MQNLMFSSVAVVVGLVLAHAAVLGGLAWLVVGRRRHGEHDSDQRLGDAGGRSHVLHHPRAYDWLAKFVTLGGEARFRRRTLALAELQPGAAVLDVGCGTGSLLIAAAKRIGPSGTTDGVDRSPEMLAHARRKAAALGIDARFHEGSSDRLPFADASFDVVFCTLMLHHLPPAMQSRTVAEMRRVVRPGGRIVVVDMARPKTVTGVFSHIGLIHLFRSRAMVPDWPAIETFLMQHGVRSITQRAIWGETVIALLGRV
jgi:ubiquinone/menaquinone biosynthesis C-methylase UbiE